MLLATLIKLTPLEAASVPVDTGRGAYALFLSLVADHDPALAEELHAADRLKPFTVSSLYGKFGPIREGRFTLHPERTYTLRLTSFGERLSDCVAKRVLPNLPERVSLLDVPFRIGGTSHDGRAHRWAGRSSFEELAQRYLMDRRPDRGLPMFFASATGFRRSVGDRTYDVPLPEPGLVFDSYLQAWNACAPVYLNPEAKRFAAECVAVSRYQLRTRLVRFGEACTCGFVGGCKFSILVQDEYWMRVMNLLAAFAFYAGTGYQTTVGQGQTRWLRYSP
jgi:CRISPR-associated endoribonuclease Cas6